MNTWLRNNYISLCRCEFESNQWIKQFCFPWITIVGCGESWHDHRSQTWNNHHKEAQLVVLLCRKMFSPSCILLSKGRSSSIYLVLYLNREKVENMKCLHLNKRMAVFIVLGNIWLGWLLIIWLAGRSVSRCQSLCPDLATMVGHTLRTMLVLMVMASSVIAQVLS